MPRLRHILLSTVIFTTGAAAQDRFELIKLTSTKLPETVAKAEAIRGPQIVKIIRIKDGDSLVGQSADGFEIDIRLAHIDAPERYQDFGDVATQELSRLCLDKIAVLSGSEKDGYGRLLASVNCGDIDVNQHMLETGHAWVYDKYNSRLTFPALEKAAAENCAGLWGFKGGGEFKGGAKAAQPPWVYRRKGADKYAETSQAQIAARTARCAKITLAAR